MAPRNGSYGRVGPVPFLAAVAFVAALVAVAPAFAALTDESESTSSGAR